MATEYNRLFYTNRVRRNTGYYFMTIPCLLAAASFVAVVVANFKIMHDCPFGKVKIYGLEDGTSCIATASKYKLDTKVSILKNTSLGECYIGADSEAALALCLKELGFITGGVSYALLFKSFLALGVGLAIVALISGCCCLKRQRVPLADRGRFTTSSSVNGEDDTAAVEVVPADMTSSEYYRPDCASSGSGVDPLACAGLCCGP